jgi:hypothetical protein
VLLPKHSSMIQEQMSSTIFCWNCLIRFRAPSYVRLIDLTGAREVSNDAECERRFSV